MTYQIAYTDTAVADLRTISTHIAQTGGDAASRRFLRRVIARVETLHSIPMRHRVRPEFSAGIRVVSVEKHLIFYRVVGGTVFIVRIIHGARNITSAMFPE